MRFTPPYRSLPLSLIAVAMILGGLGMPTPAKADRSRKTEISSEKSSRDRQALALLKYGTTVYGAMESLLFTMERQQAPSVKQLPKATVNSREADTARTISRIISTRAVADVITVQAELVREEPQLEIGLYNMLGRKVQDVYRGHASRGRHEYSATVSDLPEGVYICIMQGSDFRRAEKFYLSR